MSDPITNISDQSSMDPLAKWMASFQVAYALDESISKLSKIEPGLLRTNSGDGLFVRKITPEMLRDNLQLASEIHGLAIIGLLGFASEKGNLQFRQDIAEKLGSTRTFTIIHHLDPEDTELMTANIGSLDHAAYSSLAGVDIILEPIVEKEKDENKNKLKSESTKETKSYYNLSSGIQKNPKKLSAYLLRTREIGSRILEILRTNEKNRVKHAAKKREADAKLEREIVKEDVLKGELKNSEIAHKELGKDYKRANRNFGNQKEI